MPTARIITAILIVVASIGAFAITYLTGRYADEPGAVTESGKPNIGGPFELVNHRGEPVASSDYEGSYLLVFFGYTFCPDICPDTLTRVSTALDLLGDDAENIVPLFITIDPARDTPDYMREYISYFHPKIIGLTGSDAQIADVAKVYGVYYAKGAVDESDPESYLMDHTSITYLMDPSGRYAAHFSHGATPEDMAAGIRRVLKDG